MKDKILQDLTLSEIAGLVSFYKQPSFRATQLYDGINSYTSINEIYQLPKEFRNELINDYITEPLKEIECLKSKDGCKKYIFELFDGQFIESVFMPHDYGNTICVSTQVGCRMGCVFCASGAFGLTRNLSSGEILSQVLYINKINKSDDRRGIDNVVLMGSGEPLDNYDNVMKFISRCTEKQGINISMRSISLSTCGLVDNIKRLADEGFSGTLSISLHAASDEKRKRIMKISNKYTIKEIFDAVRYFFAKTKRRVIIEYSLIDGLNDSINDAVQLAGLIKGFAAHVNLIILNKTDNCNFIGSSQKVAKSFLDKLESQNISCTIRRSMGSDIAGACGQLRRKFVGNKED